MLVLANCETHEGCHALDLSELLGWTAPAAEPCELPEERCQGGGFQPTCGAEWGTENQEYALDQPDHEACDAPGGDVQVKPGDAPLAACTSCDGSSGAPEPETTAAPPGPPVCDGWQMEGKPCGTPTQCHGRPCTPTEMLEEGECMEGICVLT